MNFAVYYKNVIKSPIFIITTVLLGLSVLLQMVSTLINTGFTSPFIGTGMKVGIIIGMLIVMLPTILKLTGLIMNCMDGSSPTCFRIMKGVGFIKAGEIISMIYAILVYALLLFFCVFLLIVGRAAEGVLYSVLGSVMGSTGGLGYGSEVQMLAGLISSLSIVLILIVIIALVMTIFFYKGLINLCNGIKNGINMGNAQFKGLTYVVVLYILAIVFNVLGSFASISTLILSNGNAFIGILSLLVQILYPIFVTICLFKIKKIPLMVTGTQGYFYNQNPYQQTDAQYQNQPIYDYNQYNQAQYTQTQYNQPTYDQAQYNQVQQVVCGNCGQVYWNNQTNCPRCGVPRG